MKRKLERFLILTIGLIITVFGTVSMSAQTNVDRFDKLVYEFNDSSKAPSSQRNFTLIVTKNAANITVKSDKEIANSSVKISNAQFNEILQVIKAGKVRNRKKTTIANRRAQRRTR